MLHAERKVCENGSPVGAIVVHVVFDYRTLPFLTSQSAYFEVFRQSGARHRRHAGGGSRLHRLRLGPDGDLHVRADRVAARRSHVRARLSGASSRSGPCCARSGTDYNVYFSNDRLFIYALGYPRPDLFDHLVRLAELTTLAAAGYVLVLVGDAVFTRLARAAAADRSRAAARDPRQLLPQAVSRVRARVDRPGPDAGAGDPHLLRGPAARRHSRARRRARRRWRSASSRSPTPCCAAARRASRRTTTT